MMIKMDTFISGVSHQNIALFSHKNSVGWIVLPLTNPVVVAVESSCIYTGKNVRVASPYL